MNNEYEFLEALLHRNLIYCWGGAACGASPCVRFPLQGAIKAAPPPTLVTAFEAGPLSAGGRLYWTPWSEKRTYGLAPYAVPPAGWPRVFLARGVHAGGKGRHLRRFRPCVFLFVFMFLFFPPFFLFFFPPFAFLPSLLFCIVAPE